MRRMYMKVDVLVPDVHRDRLVTGNHARKHRNATAPNKGGRPVAPSQNELDRGDWRHRNQRATVGVPGGSPPAVMLVVPRRYAR